MRPYRNLSGDSGVVAYSVRDGAIDVRFANGATYRYDARVPGATHVREMVRRAQAGRGLSGYIAAHVRDRYAAKLR